MIVKQLKTNIPKMFFVNAVAAVLFCGTAAYAVRAFLFPPATPPCAERYGHPMMFNLQRSDGSLLAAGDLQSRLGGRDWGLLENLQIARLKDGPAATVLKIALPDKALRPGNTKGTTSGIGFPWSPVKMAGATSACLGYDLFLPADFEFGTGGALPGLMGGRVLGDAGDKKGPLFSTRLRWREDGGAEIRAQTAYERDGTGYAIDPNWTKLPRGQWVRIEQEVVLNTPGERDGVLRVWIDGELKLEATSMSYRSDDKAVFTGAQVDVHYGDAALGWVAPAKPASVWITPFDLRWK